VDTLLALLFLALAFGVLVRTFVWVARLLAGRGPDRAPEPEEVQPSLYTVAVPHANLGLVLGILACALFKLSPLLLILSGFGVLYSVRALWVGWVRFRVFLVRALVGLLLSLGSVGLQYLETTGQVPPLR
jgi:hypothetical protein